MDIVQGIVSALAFGGEGILRADGLVIFVPFTAPGDTIRCRITSKKKNFARGELINIIEKSPQRTTPRCPYFGTCGGCQLQHITYEAQVQHKRTCVEDALLRIGKLPLERAPEIVPSQHHWAYRRHVTLTLQPHEGHYIAGYIGVDNHTVIKVDVCPIFVPEEDRVIINLQKLVGQIRAGSSGKVSILKQEDGCLLQFHFAEMPENCASVCENAVQGNLWKGIAVSTPTHTLSFGVVEAKCQIDTLTFDFSLRAFIQNHPEQSLNIYRQICQIAKKTTAQHILDLYCGIGISSILLAQMGASVVGVESNREAVKLAKQNAQNNRIQKTRFMEADVGKILHALLLKEKPDLVIVNPPRIGLEERVRHALLEHGPRHLIYVSCNPTTLARDLQQLGNSGYRISYCEAFDMFPQTAHIETLVHMTR